MKVVAICGCMRFADEMKKIAFMLEKSHNMNVLQCVYNEENIELSEDDIKHLNEAHLEKIKISDAIYVVNLNGYIGEQVKKEIEYAQNLGKEVIYHSEFFPK